MARRLRQGDELGPVVPRWVTEHDPAKYPNQGDWVRAVWGWVDAHVPPEHRGPAYDIKERAFKMWMGGTGGA